MPAPRRPTRKSTPPRRILVVEDDRSLREGIASTLSGEGFKVDVAGDGQQGLSRLRRGTRPDLILFDLRLPQMDGWEFRAAQLADPALAGIPVIAMSGDESPKARAVHADRYLPKPFDARDLLSAVHRVLLEAECRRLQDRLRESERLAVLGTVIAGVGHEISNPLTYVLANLMEIELALRERGDDPLQELVRQTRNGAIRIESVLTSLRTLSRRDNDRCEPVDLRMVLELSIAMTGHQTCQRARLIRDIDQAPVVWGNEARLGQVFINLLTNAAQAIPRGAAQANEIRLRARAGAQHAVVEVIDTGPGISPDVKPHLFEAFFTTKPPGSGTGLGLTIARDIVIEHGGRIEVESEPGKETVFRVLLPLARPVGTPTGTADAPHS